jgi:hypothetical protein
MIYRYAVYYVPDLETEFYNLGSSLLGYSIREGKKIDYPSLTGVIQKDEFTQKATLYGFHSTIVAPFQTENSTETIISSVLRATVGHHPFKLGKLKMTLLRGCPVLSTKELMDPFLELETSLLKSLKPTFIPPNAKNLAKWGELSSVQNDLYWKWGYPFVFDQHRFHLTLGDTNSSNAYINALKDYFPNDMLENLVLDKVTLCVQNNHGGHFTVLKDFPLT